MTLLVTDADVVIAHVAVQADNHRVVHVTYIGIDRRVDSDGVGRIRLGNVIANVIAILGRGHN